jgi:hypothetical protein
MTSQQVSFIKKKYFKLLNNSDKKFAIDVENNNNIVISESHNGLHQNWSYDNKTQQFINILNKKVIDYFNNGVVLSEPSGQLSQKWFITSDSRIKSLLNNKFLTYNPEKKDLYLSEHKNAGEQLWELYYVDIPAHLLNEIELKHHENKIKEHTQKISNRKTLKISEKTEATKISIHKLPKFDRIISIQSWVRIKSFKRADVFQPLYFLNNKIGLWLYPHIFKLFVHNDFNVDYKIDTNEWFNVVQIYNFKTNSLKFFVNTKLLFNIKIEDVKKGQKLDKIDPNIFTIMNNDHFRMGTMYISNYELDKATITERYNNSMYNETNNVYKYEMNELKEKYKKLQEKFDLFKHTKCPPAEKHINNGKDNYVLKHIADKKYDDLLKQMKQQEEKCVLTNNNDKLELKHKLINYEYQIKELQHQVMEYKRQYETCNSNFI